MDFSEDNYDRISTTQSSRRSSENLKGWDVFISTPDSNNFQNSASKTFTCILKLLKVFIAFFSLVVVLSSGLLSKAIILLVASQISGITKKICVFKFPEKTFTYKYDENLEQQCWIWTMFLMLVIPDIFTFFRSIRICLFKSFRKPTTSAFLFLFNTAMDMGIIQT
ncbi:uncharacterized protein B4U80_10178 [Leptotrombidium deliense]|uniref:Chitin synthase chs-1/2 N-terminal putative transporter domain-containing protein n=1 Tax=Leptotrombidium deliense TaxID=299467 RepID=A0A443SJ52_9ACAR|nr:uncharacterized protein B4U80_10178 [Leptotrombidium deliense]